MVWFFKVMYKIKQVSRQKKLFGKKFQSFLREEGT